MIEIDRPPRPVVFLAGIYGNSPSERWVHKPIFLTSGLTAFGLLFWSLRVGAHAAQLAARDTAGGGQVVAVYERPLAVGERPCASSLTSCMARLGY